jgi:predicted enzyme related to lactoylglutathione lyase
VDEKQANTVNEIEVGRRVSGKIRFALQVPDLEAAINRLTTYGAELVHPPVETSWGDRNVRFNDPESRQITLYQSQDQS